MITLGIIGVVAAMTMPVLVGKYQEKVIVNKLKKMYSVLNSAYNMYKSQEQPEPIGLSYSKEGAEEAFKIFKPYLSIAKDCGADGAGCFYVENYTWLNGSAVAVNYGTNDLYYKVLLADGASIAFRGVDENESALQVIIFYDVNGAGAPNVRGKDMFEFHLQNNMIIPSGNSEEDFKQSCYDEGANGSACTAWVIFNENLDYLHCKGLAWSGPTSCKGIQK